MLTALITLIVIAGFHAGTFPLPSFFREIVIFLSLSTVGLYWFTIQRISGQPDDFIKIYLGATVLRILFFGGFIFTVIRLDPAGAVGNTVLFLFCYFLFTILEVVVLYRPNKLPKVSKEDPKRSLKIFFWLINE